VVTHEPFCYKDPRFSYTLPVWRPFLHNTVFVCIFRDPMATAASIVKECASMPYMAGLAMTLEIAAEVWTVMYEHILRRHAAQGEWLFLHYEQVLTGDGLDALERCLQCRVDRDFPEKRLRRSQANQPAPENAQRTYDELCQRAGFRP
jgi:hypothetical protein